MIVTAQKYIVAFFIISPALLCLTFDPVYSYEFPPYEGLTLKINGKISENYNNNITYAQDNKNRVEQWTTMLVFGLNGQYEGSRRFMKLEGQMRQPIRFNNSDVRNSSEILTFDFQNDFSQHDRMRMRDVYTHTRVPGSFEEADFREECVRLFKEYGFDVTRNDPRCAEFESEFGVSQGAFDTYRNDFNIYYNRDVSNQISVAVGYGNRRYDSTEENSNDSVANSVNGTVNYKLSYATVFFTSYVFSSTNYDTGDNVSTNSIRAGIKQYLTQRLYFTGDIGMVFTSVTDNTSFDALLRGELDEKTTASIDFSRDTKSAVDREDVFKHWRASGRIQRVLMENMNGFISAFYGKGDFVSSDVTDTLLGASVTLYYIFWQHKRGSRLDGNLGYTYSELKSTDENRGYDRSSIDATLSITF